MISRIIVIILDGVGVGALPDADTYHDKGSNTLGHLIEQSSLSIPCLSSLGLTQLMKSKEKSLKGLQGSFGKLAEKSPGKDSTTGHWELMGLELKEPFPTFPDGFPEQIVSAFEKKINKKVLGNKAASGTEIIDKLGDEHVRTGSPILYTSVDSVFQIAAHEDIIPLQELYGICRIAREMLTGFYAVGRVIARPFIGSSGSYKRTPNRRDFSLMPPGATILNAVQKSGKSVTGIGKIKDLFFGSGITKSHKTTGNESGINALLQAIQEKNNPGLILCNLIDFDTKFGHRNDVAGFVNALEYFDAKLPEIINVLSDTDVLFITADHGCDPTYPSTDHTREYVPLLVTGKHIKKGINLGIRESFADLGATIIDLLGLPPWPTGISFHKEIKKLISLAP